MWDTVLEQLKEIVTRPSFETWLKDTQCITLGEGRIYISAPNNFVAEMLETRMYSLVSSELRDILGQDIEIEFVVLVPDGSLTEMGQTG